MNGILAIGLNHKVACLELRERLAFGPERIPEVLTELLGCHGDENTAPSMSEAVILSTCNRSEIYVYASDPCRAEAALRSYLAAQSDAPGVTDLLYVFRGEQAVYHLMQVTAGLDSLVVGENEILGQVRHAAEIAQHAGAIGPMLSAMFRYAVRAGKLVRAETEISRAGLSVASLVVEIAESIFGSLSQRTALIIGAGKISTMTARALVKSGLRCVLVANRTYARALKLAEALGGRAVHFDALENTLAEADIVICSTTAPHLILHADVVAQAQKLRQGRPLLVADLAVPRDADPAIAAIPGVRLVDIDGLEATVKDHNPQAQAAFLQADEIIQSEANAYEAWCSARRCAPLIQALRAKAESVCQEEVEQALRRMGDLTPQQQRIVRALGETIVGKLLHQPIACLREPLPEAEMAEYIQLVQALYGLKEPISR